MNMWSRWRVALPLAGISSIFLVAAVYGGITWWPASSPSERLLTVIICLLLVVGLFASLSIAVRPDRRDVPWSRIGVAVLALLLSCAVTLLRRALT